MAPAKSTSLAAITGTPSPPSAGAIAFEGESLLAACRPSGSSDEESRSSRRDARSSPPSRSPRTSSSEPRSVARPQRGHATTSNRVLDRFPILRTYYKASAPSFQEASNSNSPSRGRSLVSPGSSSSTSPSLGLAPIMIDRVFEFPRRLRNPGSRCCSSNRTPPWPVALADRTYVLRTGRVALSGQRDELLADTDLCCRLPRRRRPRTTERQLDERAYDRNLPAPLRDRQRRLRPPSGNSRARARGDRHDRRPGAKLIVFGEIFLNGYETNEFTPHYALAEREDDPVGRRASRGSGRPRRAHHHGRPRRTRARSRGRATTRRCSSGREVLVGVYSKTHVAVVCGQRHGRGREGRWSPGADIPVFDTPHRPHRDRDLLRPSRFPRSRAP